MKPASARRISSHADGPDVARARGRTATSAAEWAYIFGAIMSREGERRRAGHDRHKPWCDGDGHGGAPHRDQCRRRSRRPCGFLIVDQAGWHLTPKLAIPATSPSDAAATIARVEPGGECLAIHADNWLSNRIFKSYARHRRAVLPAWNNLIDQPWTIMSPRHASNASPNGVRSTTVGIIRRENSNMERQPHALAEMASSCRLEIHVNKVRLCGYL